MKTFIVKVKYLLKNILWVLTGYFGRSVSLDTPDRVTVLITYFNPVRMKKINHQIRNILKCSFVDRLIISNHNPEVHIEKKITIKDRRLIVLNQPVKRGCGFRWQVANDFKFKYLIVIDDDFLIFPGQLARLFKHLLNNPEIPHGLSGMNYLPNYEFEFRDRQDVDVDFLCEVYAVTASQLKRYLEIASRISFDEAIARSVNSTADFMIISHTGVSRPQIHNVGRLFRDETFQTEGIAVHKDLRFNEEITRVFDALRIHKFMV